MYSHNFEGTNEGSSKERKVGESLAKDKYLEVTHKKSFMQKKKK